MYEVTSEDSHEEPQQYRRQLKYCTECFSRILQTFKMLSVTLLFFIRSPLFFLKSGFFHCCFFQHIDKFFEFWHFDWMVWPCSINRTAAEFQFIEACVSCQFCHDFSDLLERNNFIFYPFVNIQFWRVWIKNQSSELSPFPPAPIHTTQTPVDWFFHPAAVGVCANSILS